MSEHQQKTYLSFQEQEKIASRISGILEQDKSFDFLTLKYGKHLVAGIMVLSGIGMWHVGFVAWNIKKYSKGRLWTAMVAASFCPAAAVSFEKFVTLPLFSSFRKENKWYYGVQAVFGNQLCLLVQTAFSVGYTFASAQMYNIMPIEANYMSKKHRAQTLKYVSTRLAPFTRRLIGIHVLSNAAVFFLATRSYTESVYLLERIGRKTMGVKGD